MGDDHRLDDPAVEPVRSVLEQHARLGDVAPLLMWLRNGRRRSLRLPHGSDPTDAARESLVKPGATWTLRWAAVVWRAEIEMADGSRVPVRYACVHLAGRPQADLVVQHYTATDAGEVPLGEPEAVDRVAPLIPPWQPRRRRERADRGWLWSWCRSSRMVALSWGLLAGIVAAAFTVDVAGRFGPAVVHDATITEMSVAENARHDGHYTILAETSSGEVVDFAYTPTEQLHQVLVPGQRVRVTLSALTGRPIALETRTAHYDFLAGPRSVVGGVIVAAMAVFMVLLQARVRYRWALPAALAGFILFGLRLLGFF